MNNLSKKLIKLVISFLILYYVLSKLDLTNLLYKLDGINWYYLIPVLLLLPLSLFFMSLKFRIFIKKISKVSLKKMFFLYWASDFTGLFSLGSLGSEAYKMIQFKNKKKALFLSLLDKGYSFIWYLLFGVIVFLLSFFLKNNYSIFFISLILYFSAVILLQGVGNYTGLTRLAKIKSIARFLNIIRLNRKEVIYHSLWSLIFLLNTVLIYFIIFRVLGIQVSIIKLFVLIPLLIIALTLPISIQGIGVRDFLFLKFAEINGLNLELLISASLISFMLGILYKIMGFIPFLILKGEN